MTRPPGRLPPDPRRKARFREIAREIVAKDRHDRKHGFTVNTAGAIAQALERAYRDGARESATGPSPVAEQPDTGPVEWALIPPRPRNAFWSICLFTLGRDAGRPRDGHLAPAVTERGTPGWTLVVPGHSPHEVIGDRTITPLVRLGLLEPAPDLPLRLLLAERGCETWSNFCRQGGQFPEDLTDI